jgi:glucose-6-phosphate isomerase
VNINAYHQPGVEAGKKAATSVLELQAKVRQIMSEGAGVRRNASEIAALLHTDDVETVFHVLQHLGENHSAFHGFLSANAGQDAFVMS